MIKFDNYINELITAHNIADDADAFRKDFAIYCLKNNWFNMRPVIDNGVIFINDSKLDKVKALFESFSCNYNRPVSDKFDLLSSKFSKLFPDTAKYFKKYSTVRHLELNDSYRLMDFMISNLVGELYDSPDREIVDFLNVAHAAVSKSYCNLITDFVNWLKTTRKTVAYQNLYFVDKYSDKSDSSEAYEPDEYLKILYHIFNSDYISKNSMYRQATSSKNYVDTWLFLSLNFLCALRTTDLVRFPHPRLVTSPEETLEQIASDTFSDADAKIVLASVVWHLDAIMLKPNKTSRISGVSAIKFHVPASLEVHMGTLFAAAEAHFQLKKISQDEPLIRMITSYESINRYMGAEIGNLFLESNFRCRSANKSFLQMVEMLTDDVLGTSDDYHCRGYMLAALARSHKGSYGNFSATTSVYIRDAKMSGYTASYVARELFERGVLSAIPSMLLKMITNEAYDKLSVPSQTDLINVLNMTPMDVEKTVALMQANMTASIEIVKAIYQSCSKERILQILHRIGSNQAPSKCDGCLCVMSAMKKLCPYPDNANCISCEYEISTKTTMYLMVKEYKRLIEVYSKSHSELEKSRCKSMAQSVILPAINEMLSETEAQYGPEALKVLEQIVSKGVF